MNALSTKAHKRTYATTAKIKALAPTLVAVARECGLDVTGIEVSPDGAIRVIESREAPKGGNDFDRFADQL